jgi:hypothetical protein
MMAIDRVLRTSRIESMAAVNNVIHKEEHKAAVSNANVHLKAESIIVEFQ